MWTDDDTTTHSCPARVEASVLLLEYDTSLPSAANGISAALPNAMNDGCEQNARSEPRLELLGGRQLVEQTAEDEAEEHSLEHTWDPEAAVALHSSMQQRKREENTEVSVHALQAVLRLSCAGEFYLHVGRD